MSIEVRPDALAETVAGFAVAYLLTVGGRPRPHVGAVTATVDDGVVRVGRVGRTALRDVSGDAAVTLLWAPAEPGGYSLIVDGTATVVEDGIEVLPGRAVLHRPASPTQSSTGPRPADCVEVPVEAATSWSPDELDRIDAAEELEIAARGSDGALRRRTPIWVVRVEDHAYVRTWHRRDTGWFGRAVASGRARVRVPGLEADVAVDDVGDGTRELRAAVDGAYRVKYARYGRSVDAMVAHDAAASTLRLRPERDR